MFRRRDLCRLPEAPKLEVADHQFSESLLIDTPKLEEGEHFNCAVVTSVASSSSHAEANRISDREAHLATEM